MDSQVQNDTTMQYGHMSLQDRRDPNLDGNGSAQFHPNGLGQALSSHLAGPYARTATDYRNPSTSPPSLAQQGSNASHSPLTFTTAVQSGATSPAVKRKHADGSMTAAQMGKRRRSDNNPGGEDPDNAFDIDGPQGAKHWTDVEKSKLFEWLMGPGQEDHWNALRATKNSCLRDCALQVFGGKKTYQALKGCYERNFNLFKQIYAFENAHGQGAANMTNLSEADRLREYERRLQIARKAGSDVGNITARTIEHWHRVGWYRLFYERWHGDPATMRQTRTNNVPSAAGMGNGPDDPGPEDDDPTLDFNDPTTTLGGLNGVSHDRQPVYINPQELRDHPPPPQQQQVPGPGPIGPPIRQQQVAMPPLPQSAATLGTPHGPPPPSLASHMPPGSAASPADASLFTFSVTQDILSRCLHLMNLQTKISQERLEIMKRRETREMNELSLRKETYDKTALTKDKINRAFDLINNQNADPSLKQVASDYLRKILLQE